jgi:hypothetical protein
MNNNRWKIKQIIPAAPGWKAIHCAASENGPAIIFNRAIICWALVEDSEVTGGGRTQVRGMEQRFDGLTVVDDLINAPTIAPDGVDRNEYFLAYDDPHGHRESSYWIGEAERRLSKEKEARAK